MGNLSLNISNSTIACQPANIIIKNEKFQKIIQKLYFMVEMPVENLNNSSCDQIRTRLGTLWFIIYSLVLLLILFIIVCLSSACCNLFFKIEKIKSFPTSDEEIVKLLIEKYNPSKADNYFYKAQKRLEKNKSPVKIEVVESDVSSIEDNSSLENNIPKRFDLENFLNNDDHDDDESFVSYKPPLNLTFPAINDEVELYMKLLLAQVTSRNHSVENSSVYKIYDEYKNMIKPKVIYKKSLELALNALNYFK